MLQPIRITGFHTEILCLQCGQKVVQAECLKCTWFATGSREAVHVAERAHQRCRHAREATVEAAAAPR